MRRYYVGLTSHKEKGEVIFTDDPSEAKWGDKFLILVGPFRHKRAASVCASRSPILATVAEYEKLITKES